MPRTLGADPTARILVKGPRRKTNIYNAIASSPSRNAKLHQPRSAEGRGKFISTGFEMSIDDLRTQVFSAMRISQHIPKTQRNPAKRIECIWHCLSWRKNFEKVS